MNKWTAFGIVTKNRCMPPCGLHALTIVRQMNAADLWLLLMHMRFQHVYFISSLMCSLLATSSAFFSTKARTRRTPPSALFITLLKVVQPSVIASLLYFGKQPMLLYMTVVARLHAVHNTIFTKFNYKAQKAIFGIAKSSAGRRVGGWKPKWTSLPSYSNSSTCSFGPVPMKG